MNEMNKIEILLPPQATAVYGVKNPAVLLNSPKGGAWKFLFEAPDCAPCPEAENQDFDFTALSGNDRKNVCVPGELSVQGFDIVNNTEYYYQRQLYIPADYKGNKVILRFDGVYTNARVWIDGHYIRTHKGGFVSWDCDITKYAKPGGIVTLTVGVADIFGNDKGIWNPEGIRKADASGATFYANHNIGGITRDVTLMALPPDYIADIHTDISFDDTYTDANLKITARLGMVSPSAELKFELSDKNGCIAAEGSLRFEKSESAIFKEEKSAIYVKSPKKWDAEHPNLYTLKMTLTTDGIEKEICVMKIGFREIVFGGKKGTDKNKVYINGKQIKLRGVCRHDVSLRGRSTIREEDYAEISDYKKCNINFIRTSHYTVSRNLLDACDELGIYVEEENAACWGPVECLPEEYLNQFKEMIIRDKNRACIIIWSIANESTWAKPFEMEYDYITKTDSSRLVIFSFAHTSPEKFDICSVHYDNWASKILGDSRAYYKRWNQEKLFDHEVPVLHDEYCPSAVHHYADLQRDLSARNFWGESVRRFWDNIFDTDGALGGAFWAAGDEVFYIPEGHIRRIGAQGHTDGPAVGDGTWGVVHDAYKRLKPEAYNCKKGYTPIRIDEKKFSVKGDTGNTLEIPVRNRFDHTYLSEIKAICSIDGGAAFEVAMPHIAPHEFGTISILGDWDKAEQANLKFYTIFDSIETMVDEFNIDIKEKIYRFIPAAKEAPLLVDAEHTLTVSGDDFSVVFDKKIAQIRAAEYKGKTLITGGPNLHICDIDFGRFIPEVPGGFAAVIKDNTAMITLRGAYENGQGVEFVITITKNGIISATYTLTTEPVKTDNIKECGIIYDTASDIESVSWIRRALHSAYPESHIGRAEGTAMKVRKDCDFAPDPYGIKPRWNWEDDMKDFTLYHKGDPNNGIVTNDFKTMREHVRTYTLNFANTKSKICVESEDASLAARIETKADWELIDDRDPQISYSGNWTQRENHTHAPEHDYAGTRNFAYNGTETISGAAGDFCELRFVGTGICFISARGNDVGRLNAYIDGELKEQVQTFAGWGPSKKRVVYALGNLPYGEHTVKIEAVDPKIAVDAFGVLKNNPPKQHSRLIINNQWFYPQVAYGSYQGVPGKLAKGSSAAATIRLCEVE